MAQGGIIQLIATGPQDKLSNTHQSKVVTCLVTYPYNLSLHKEDTKFQIPRSCDVMNNWSLLSDIGFDVIDSVEIEANGLILVRASGRCLCIMSMLLGMDPRKRKTLKVPFPVMNIVALPYVQLNVCTRFRQWEKPYLEEHKKIKPFVIKVLAHSGDLADIVVDYLGMDHDIGSVSLYSATIMREENDRKKISGNPTVDIIDQYQEISSSIKPLEENIKVDLWVFNVLLKRLIIVFHRTNGSNCETLDVLNQGTLITYGVPHTEFTGDSAHHMDKEMFDMYVPEQPIYTITFDNGKNITDPRRTSSFMNFRGSTNKVFLRLTVKPQEFPMTVTVIGESANLLMTANGMCGLKYSQ